MMQVTNKYPEARGGDIEGTGSNGEDMQMYKLPSFAYVIILPIVHQIQVCMI